MIVSPPPKYEPLPDVEGVHAGAYLDRGRLSTQPYTCFVVLEDPLNAFPLLGYDPGMPPTIIHDGSDDASPEIQSGRPLQRITEALRHLPSLDSLDLAHQSMLPPSTLVS